MIWTRKPLAKTSDWFNQKPLAPLDETLRLPLAMEEILRLLKEEYGVVLKKELFIVKDGYFYFRPFKDYFFQLIFQPRIYFLPCRLIHEVKTAKNKWQKNVEEFLTSFNQLKQENLAKLSNEELLFQVKETIKFDAYWIFKLGFGLPIFYHYISEMFLKFFYGFLVKDKYSQNYHELLIGYPSKLKEADFAFWRVVEGKLSLNGYLEKYGFRATDVSLVIPTIGEDKKFFSKQADSLRGITLPDFNEKTNQIIEKRKLREKYVSKNFRSWIPFGKSIFSKVLKVARDYISIREERRFYYTMGTFLVRKCLLVLGERIKFLSRPDDIFFLEKDELEKLILNPKDFNKDMIQIKIDQHKKQWNVRSQKFPPEEIKL